MNTDFFFVWIAAALCCAVLELSGRRTLWWVLLHGGALAAAVGSLFGCTATVQLCLFIVLSFVPWGAKHLFTRYARRLMRVGVTDLVGRQAQVIRPVAPESPGIVAVDGRSLIAHVDLPAIVLAGTHARVVAQGNDAVVIRPLVCHES